MGRRTKTAFGAFLVKEIREAGMSQEDFYKAAKIAKPYFYDLLTATPPPIDLQNRMLAVLDEKTGADEKRRNEFYDLAAAGRKEIPGDIAKLILEHPQELGKIREILTTLLTAQG